MLQVPVVRIVSVVDDTEHTEDVVEAKLTGREDEAEAVSVSGALP